jgi:hypothetical protein
MKHRILQVLLKTLLTLRLYYFVSLIIIKLAKHVVRIPCTSDVNKSEKYLSQLNIEARGGGHPSIIVFNKTGLLEDIYAIRKSATQENIDFPHTFVIPRFVIDIIAEHFLSERQRYDFLDKDEWNESAHRKLNVCWKAILKHLRKKWNCSMIISANYTYGNERDAQNAAAEIGLKVLILYKECFMSKGHSEDLLKVLSRSRKFHGTKLLLYNAGEMGRQLNSGMARLDQLVVVGSPRFDEYISSSTKSLHVNDCKIVFFVHDFVPAVNAGQYSIQQDHFNTFSNSQIDFGLFLIISAAQKFPELNFEIKTKITKVSIEKVEEWSKTVAFPPNLSISNGGLSEGSIKNCIGAIGFNTTALVDAMASGVPIAVLKGEGLSGEIEQFAIDYGAGATKLSNTQDIESWIATILKGQDSFGNVNQSIDPQNFDFLIDSIGNADGNASFRALREIISMV